MDHPKNSAPLRRVKITTQGERVDIEIDGVRIDPGAVRAYNVSHIAGESPEIVLHVADRWENQWAGMARVATADLPDPGPAAAVFLGEIDAETLERTVLDRPDLGSEPYALTKAMLVQLAEWARGL